MLEHVAKRQAEQRDSIRKSFMASGGSDASNGAEYSQSSNEDVTKSGMKKTMDEWKEGDLKSGSGAKVTNQKQAIAIGLSEEDKEKKTKKKGEGDEEVEKGDEGEGGVVAGTEAWDEKKDKTKLTKGYPPTTTGMTPQQHKELTKSETMIDYLSNGEYHEHQKAQILATYGVTDIQKSKTGEGTRGGNIIGHTKSGKPIYGDRGAGHYKDFSSEDHSEAARAHTKEFKKWAGTKESDWVQDKKKQNAHDKHATSHEEAKKKNETESAQRGLGTGGKEIGKTKSGKSIPQLSGVDSDYADWSAEDHRDAKELHTSKREAHKPFVGSEHDEDQRHTKAFRIHNNEVESHGQHATNKRNEEVERAKKLTGLK